MINTQHQRSGRITNTRNQKVAFATRNCIKAKALQFFFNKETRTVDCSYMVFRRNQTPIEPGYERLSHSSKYGHWQKEWPVLGKEDIDFIYHKWHELFDQPKPVDASKILDAMNIRKSEEK